MTEVRSQSDVASGLASDLSGAFGELLDEVRAVERKLLAMGCPKINLLIRSGNVAVKDFYATLGFEQDEVISLGKRLIPDL